MLRLRRREQAPLRESDIAGFPYGFNYFHAWIVANQVTILEDRWEDIVDLVQTSKLPGFQAPDPNDLDAINSKIEATWRKEDSFMVDEYDGKSASNLFDSLQAAAVEINSRSQVE